MGITPTAPPSRHCVFALITMHPIIRHASCRPVAEGAGYGKQSPLARAGRIPALVPAASTSAQPRRGLGVLSKGFSP